MGALNTCQSATPQIVSISPPAMSEDTESSVLTVSGENFSQRSRIMWNGTALPTAFVDSSTLQTTITPQTFSSFGGAAGGSVQISVMSMGASVPGCSGGGLSATFSLEIN